MPTQKPGRSKQDYATPFEFYSAVQKRLGIAEFEWDLAASADNTIAANYLTEEQNSLTRHWHHFDGWCWLNPPYADIRPWTQKCWEESRKGAHIALLVPSSTGSNWWREWVTGKAYVTFLNGRITFVGAKDPYPKDLALLLYAPFLEGGSCTWNWRQG
jgi:phage N-6-adenine-methyltransferase